MNPPILVLDDATSAIDVQIEQQIHEALRGLMAGRTTLIIAHRLSTISLADRVAVVEGGRVIAEGTHAELLATEPRYAEILARTEEDARRRAVERDEARADFEREDRRLLGTAADDDVARSRGLDADLGELADRDPELATHGEGTLMAWGGGTITGGAPMGGSVGGSPGNPGNGLPFAGIPWEMRQGVEKLLADEPDLAGDARWSVGEVVHPPDAGGRRQPRAACCGRTGGCSLSRSSSSSSRRSCVQAGPFLSRSASTTGSRRTTGPSLVIVGDRSRSLAVVVSAIAERSRASRSPAGSRRA